MSAAMDMALDDIIDSRRKDRGPRRGGRGGRGGRRGGFNRNDRSDDRSTSFGSYKKSENSGGAFRRERINKRNSKPYEGEKMQTESTTNDDVLNDEETVWQHDLYEKVEQGEEPNVDFPQSHGNLSLETGTKILISNLDYGVTADDLKDLFQQVGDVKKTSIHYDRSGRSEGSGDVIFARKGDAEEAIKKYNGVELDKKPMRITLVGSALATRSDNQRGFRGSRRGSSSSRLRGQGTRRNIIRRRRGGYDRR